MIMAGYTTIEQSRKLIELGIDVNTADMFYDNPDLLNNPPEIIVNHNYPFNDSDIPCWTTEALLDILDETIVTNEEDEYTLHFGKDGTSYYMHYEDAYRSMNNIIDELDFCCSTLLNCAFEMIVKLKEMRLL